MSRFVVLLRGVNVGRGNRVPMAEFRSLLETLGHTDVRTILNSGNAVFTSSARSSKALSAEIRSALVAKVGVDVPVIVKSARELNAIVAENSLAAKSGDHSRLLVAFPQHPAALKELEAVKPLVCKPEELRLGKHVAYLSCANGILESKAAAALLGKTGKSCTTRNWATVLKLAALIGKQSA